LNSQVSSHHLRERTEAELDFEQQYGNGAYCFDMITINYGGKTTQAQIVDMV
jgi:hypothetical protein